jgi:hypothetical protein
MNPKPKLPEPFLKSLKDLESAYLAQTDPAKQSGFHGGDERWRTERGLILKAVDSDGDFLDIGCANGYLVECLAEWAKALGITLDPYGVDQGSGLIELAKTRYPHHASHFWVGNAWDWTPPKRFHYVYTMIDFVPEDLLKDYITRLANLYVADPGILIVGDYKSMSTQQPASDMSALLAELGLPVAGEARIGELPNTHIAWTRITAGTRRVK